MRLANLGAVDFPVAVPGAVGGAGRWRTIWWTYIYCEEPTPSGGVRYRLASLNLVYRRDINLLLFELRYQ